MSSIHLKSNWIVLAVSLALAGCSLGGRHTSSSKLSANAATAYSIGNPPAGTTGGNPAMVSNIMDSRCAQCHGPDSPARAGINDIQNLYQNILTGRVVPQHPELSSLYQMAAGQGPCGPAIPKDELRTIEEWINSLPTNILDLSNTAGSVLRR